MQKNHEVALLNALDKLYVEGAVAIRTEDLYLWFRAERIHKSVYRELLSRWQELCDYYGHEEAPCLSILQECNVFAKRIATMLKLRRDIFEHEHIVSFNDSV